jgi:DNA-directed RNA polymerase subunit omega
MIIPSPDRLQNRVGSKYALVIVAAKRARLIKEGNPPLLRASTPNPLTVALEEVAAGKVIPSPDQAAVEDAI